MRARRHHLLVTLIAAVVVALTSQFAPAPAAVADGVCPASTTWDNFLKRCV
ncbi:hypothetical protein GCM10010172_57780 [Paractinoplanes ferrugineus]|uniref:Uncharacterized protein n=1 Tax=Paractinoplanes ferrugineus TaxID=113564 RepID=A0A919MHK3_9ACTN|nr:hypothetical protein [Actinoplanes ferrugineus]GIE15918.1 hypothetical protein Afe05nite_77580 [Actinoplanes ferrugineus]